MPVKKDSFDHLMFLQRIEADVSLQELRKALAGVLSQYPVDIDSLSKELSSYAVDLPVDYRKEPVGKINEALAKIQSYKDRLTELKKEVLKAIYYYDRLYTQAQEHIRLSYAEVRELQSEELRKAVISESLREFEIPQARAHFAESLIKTTLENLNSKNDNASRQLSVVMAQIQLGELRSIRPT
jgi:hydroxypyruvate isomerase